MGVSLFGPMGHIFTTVFADRAHPTVQWIRHDNAAPVELRALFENEYAAAALGEVEITDVQPVLFVEVAVARRYEGARPLKALFDNRDRIVAEGITYRVSDCRPDGQVMVSVTLRKAEE